MDSLQLNQRCFTYAGLNSWIRHKIFNLGKIAIKDGSIILSNKLYLISSSTLLPYFEDFVGDET